jgi:hypothetical protein
MSDDKQAEQTERPQQNPHRVGQIDPSFRNDKQYLGLNTALILLVASLLTYLSDGYTFIVAGSFFLLAMVITVISFPYKTFQEEE